MGEPELLLLMLMLAVGGLSVLAGAVRVPYPIVLLLGGLVLGFVPGVPPAELPPELVLVLFLPPLLFQEASSVSLRELRANAREITLLAVGLVLATMTAVAAVAHALVGGLPWAAAFALGAIVSPTDPLAATAIGRRLGVPRRLVTVLEGESLVNDATALVAYRLAVAAVVAGSFSLWEAGVRFVAGAVGGVAIGLAVGWLIAEALRRIEDPVTEIVLSVVTGYAAYLPADRLGLSGVLAAVTAGLYVGWRAPQLASPSTRLLGFSFWEVLVSLLNAVLFVLVGLQLHPILTGVSGHSAAVLVGQAALVSAVVIVTRLVWGFTVPYLIRALDRRPAQWARRVGARERLVAGWSGMRGAVSLAAALALPLTTSTGQPFPHRHLIIFLTFGVIFATLVGQGLTLPWLIRRLGLHHDDIDEQEELGGACGPPTRPWSGWRSSPPRTGPATTPSSGCGGCTSSAAGASRPAAATWPTTAPRTARWPTSGWSASCWRPSGARSCCSATRARSATRSWAASSATSTWRTPSSRSGRPLNSPRSSPTHGCWLGWEAGRAGG